MKQGIMNYRSKSKNNSSSISFCHRGKNMENMSKTKYRICTLLVLLLLFSFANNAMAASTNTRTTHQALFVSSKGAGYSAYDAVKNASTNFNEGQYVYVWNVLYDDNEKLIESYNNGVCNLTMAAYRPDGTCAFSHTYKNSTCNWIRIHLNQEGKWKIVSSISGAITRTGTREINVKERKHTTYNDVFATTKKTNVYESRGSAATTFTKGQFIYVWGYIHDQYDMLYTKYGAGSVNLTLSLIRPNGSTAHSYTYKNSDSNWIGCELDAVGQWKIRSQVSGAVRGTNTQTITVKESASTLNLSGAKAPDSILQGRGFTCTGTISSNYNIETVIVGIWNAAGKEITSYTVYPNTTKYDINKLDSYIHFSYAKEGTNYYKIWAKDSKKSAWLLNKKFTVKKRNSYPDAKPIPNLNGLDNPEKLARVAESQVGYFGGPGGTGYGYDNTVYGAYTGSNPAQWCASFVSWCANQAKISKSVVPKNANTLYQAQGSSSYRKWNSTSLYNIKRGDVIYFSTTTDLKKNGDKTVHHVGIVSKVDIKSSIIWITEGNTGKDVVLTRQYKIVNKSTGKFSGNGWSGEYFCGYISI